MKKGFTLIEFLFAVAIFTIGILSVFSLIPLSVKYSDATKREVTASNLAQGLIDETIHLGYDQLPLQDTGTISYTNDSLSPYFGYQKRVVAEWVDSDLASSQTETGLKRLKVIISWKQGGKDKDYTLATLISKK